MRWGKECVRKNEIKLFFADDGLVYFNKQTKQNPRQSAEGLLELIQELTKMIEHKSNR